MSDVIRRRQDLEAAEAAVLAPWAQKVADSFGREHAEPKHKLRTTYQRDRARVIHSEAFRRLEYKTQVFLNGTGDHLRTRLTHTMEVASVSRVIARALGLNEDLAETIALAHDMGHAPFGHTGEDRLDRLMKGHGGFEHNMQSLRIVEFIERKHPDTPGLNLSYELREGLRKHDQGYQRADEHFPSPSLEAQVANLADEIAYYSHDLDDGLDAGLLKEGDLEAVDLWRQCAVGVQETFPGFDGSGFRRQLIRNLIDLEVDDVVAATAQRIEESEVQSADDVRRQAKPLVGYSDELRRANQQLRKFLYQNLYFHPQVAEPNQRAADLIERVFSACMENPQRMGQSTLDRKNRDGLERVVCDYVSGMTDRYLMTAAGELG
jgi:dGTPase